MSRRLRQHRDNEIIREDKVVSPISTKNVRTTEVKAKEIVKQIKPGKKKPKLRFPI